MRPNIPDALGDIYEKVQAGERLSAEDGMRLYATPELNAVGYMANIVRERMCGNVAWYVRNQHINYTNICNKLCKFCSFYVPPKDARGYVLYPEDVQERVRRYLHVPITEIHMVAGINPKLPYSYYLDIVRAVKEVRPNVAVKAFTAIEWVQIARAAKKPLREAMLELKEAGVSSIPGGGAEVFSDRVRGDLFWTKADSEEWLEVAQTAHEVGLFFQCDDALRPHRESEREGRTPGSAAGAAGRDGWVFDLYSPFFSSGADRDGTDSGTDGDVRFERDCGRPAYAGQFPAYQDVLDYEYDRDLAGRAVVRGGRYRWDDPGVRDYAADLRGDPAVSDAEALMERIVEAGRDPVERDNLYNVISTEREIQEEQPVGIPGELPVLS